MALRTPGTAPASMAEELLDYTVDGAEGEAGEEEERQEWALQRSSGPTSTSASGHAATDRHTPAALTVKPEKQAAPKSEDSAEDV